MATGHEFGGNEFIAVYRFKGEFCDALLGLHPLQNGSTEC